MNAPVFKHDCSGCGYLGHFFSHDVYICGTGDNTVSILARFGNESHEYASTDLEDFLDKLNNREHRIGGVGLPNSMIYQDYVFSGLCSNYTKAMVLALAVKPEVV